MAFPSHYKLIISALLCSAAIIPPTLASAERCARDRHGIGHYFVCRRVRGLNAWVNADRAETVSEEMRVYAVSTSNGCDENTHVAADGQRFNLTFYRRATTLTNPVFHNADDHNHCFVREFRTGPVITAARWRQI